MSDHATAIYLRRIAIVEDRFPGIRQSDPTLWSLVKQCYGMRQVGAVIEERHPTGAPDGFIEILTLDRLREVMRVVHKQDPWTTTNRETKTHVALNAAEAQYAWAVHNGWQRTREEQAETWAWVAAGGLVTRPEPRQPDIEYGVYQLGHYEQMIVEKALASAESLDDDERVTAQALRSIFAAHGTVTVIRNNLSMRVAE